MSSRRPLDTSGSFDTGAWITLRWTRGTRYFRIHLEQDLWNGWVITPRQRSHQLIDGPRPDASLAFDRIGIVAVGRGSQAPAATRLCITDSIVFNETGDALGSYNNSPGFTQTPGRARSWLAPARQSAYHRGARTLCAARMLAALSASRHRDPGNRAQPQPPGRYVATPRCAEAWITFEKSGSFSL